MHYNEVQWEWVRQADQIMASANREELIDFVKRFCEITDEHADRDRLRLAEQYCRW